MLVVKKILQTGRNLCQVLGVDATKEEEPFHHFQLLSHPNCRGDVIFLTDGLVPVGFASQNYINYMICASRGCENYFHTPGLSRKARWGGGSARVKGECLLL